MAQLLPTSQLNLPLSERSAALSRDWGLGACWYAAATACQELRRLGTTTRYCQGWVIEEDGGITYCVSHAFLLDARGLVVDPHHHLLDLNPRWVVVERWSYSALELHLAMSHHTPRGGLPIGFQMHPTAMPDESTRYRAVLVDALTAAGIPLEEVHPQLGGPLT